MKAKEEDTKCLDFKHFIGLNNRMNGKNKIQIKLKLLEEKEFKEKDSLPLLKTRLSRNM